MATIKNSTLSNQPNVAIFHNGNEQDSGHYFTYFRQRNSTWVCVNDMEVCTAKWPNNGKEVQSIQIAITGTLFKC